MMSSSAFILLLCTVPVTGVLRGTGHQSSKILSDMRPEVVSQLLSTVEKKWTEARVMVLRNATDGAEAYASMEASCLKVSSAIVAGSEGEKYRVVEYMQDVCGAPAAKEAPTVTMCTDFASGIAGVMTDDEGFNRDTLDLKPFCSKFWARTVLAAAQAEEKHLVQAETQREEKEKKNAAEEKKKDEEVEVEEQKKTAQVEEEKKAAKAEEEEEEKKTAETTETTAQQQGANEEKDVQSQNATMAETSKANVSSEPAAEVPPSNATSAVAVESAASPTSNVSASTETATENTAPASNVSASTETATKKNVTALVTARKLVSKVNAVNKTEKAPAMAVPAKAAPTNTTVKAGNATKAANTTVKAGNATVKAAKK